MPRLVLLLLAPLLLAACATQPRIGRTQDGKPDLNGIWEAMGSAHWNLEPHNAQAGPLPQMGALGAIPAGLGVVEGGRIPYTAEAAAKRAENKANWLERDPLAKCYMPGVPRATYMPYPFQIFQYPDRVVILYEYLHATREIFTDGSRHPEIPVEFWLGDSRGRWQGESLIVDVTLFTNETWFDRAGNFHSDGLHVIEQYTRTGPDHMAYEVTIEDPKVFTRPWKMRMPLYRRQEPASQLLEFECYAYAREGTDADAR
jgi:hypothetical protein